MKGTILKIKLKARTVYFVYLDKRTNLIAKAITGIAIMYAFSPIDLIPDFIPVLGLLDDIVILPFLIYIAFLFVPKDELEDARKRAMSDEVINKKWYFAIPIVLTWALIIYLIKRGL